MTNTSPDRWRTVIAVLANPVTRRIFGTLLRGDDPADDLAALAAARRRSVMKALTGAGVAVERDGSLELLVATFDELLRSSPTAPRATGVERFLRDGRIEGWPSAARDREALLAWVLERALPNPDNVDERTLTTRLSELGADPVGLRRALVDAGLVDREPDGSAYSRAV